MGVETKLEQQARVSVTLVNAPSPWTRAKARLKRFGGHLGLILVLLVYTAGGAKVFQVIELPREQAEFQRVYHSVMAHRRRVVGTLVNDSQLRSSETGVRDLLREYETELLGAIRGGIDLTPEHHDDHHFKWNYIHSLFFSSTVLTTIGYGNMAPRTPGGRIFCMFFALVGIPLTLTVIADLGALFATSVASLHERMKRRWWPPGSEVPGKLQLSDRQERALAFFVPLLFLVLYIAIGGALFLLWESWTFLESFYFCFITMTTIGFGDFVPANAEYMLVCTLYILVGLALTTTIIEIVRRQYAKSWQQMKMLTARLQSLSGPLTEHLKKLGEHGHGVTMDVDLLREIKELRRTVAQTKMKHDGAFAWDDTELDALTPRPPLLQIVIYESNV